MRRRKRGGREMRRRKRGRRDMRRRKRGGRTEEEYKEEGSGWITKVLIARFIVRKMLQTVKLFPNSLPSFNIQHSTFF